MYLTIFKRVIAVNLTITPLKCSHDSLKPTKFWRPRGPPRGLEALPAFLLVQPAAQPAVQPAAQPAVQPAAQPAVQPAAQPEWHGQLVVHRSVRALASQV